MKIAQTEDQRAYEIVDTEERDYEDFLKVKPLCNYLTKDNKLTYGRIYGNRPINTYIKADKIIRIDEVDIKVDEE